MSEIQIDKIWWRNVQLGEFYNIERHPQIEGGGGSLYIEIPGSLVKDTLDFLDIGEADIDNFPATSISVKTVTKPYEVGLIEFQKKAGGRMRIANQNRQQKTSQRHPAWSSERGFPKAPDWVRNRDDAAPYFPSGGLRIYIARTLDRDFYAGFTQGPRPVDMKSSHPMWDLDPSNPRQVGGLIS